MSMLTCSTLPHDDSEGTYCLYFACNDFTVCLNMPCVLTDAETDEPTDTATTFNAETHVKVFEDTFKHLGFNEVVDFAFAQVADSTALNPKIARLLRIVHVACRNHCLNLACQDMEKSSQDLSDLSAKTHENHKKINSSNKLTAALANVQQAAYHLKMKAATRWTYLTDMFLSHLQAEDDIREVARQFPDKIDDGTVSSNFISRMKQHISYLNVIKTTACELQTEKATLGNCVDVLELLSEEVLEGYRVRGHEFQHCKLESDRFEVGNKYDSGMCFTCFSLLFNNQVLFLILCKLCQTKTP